MYVVPQTLVFQDFQTSPAAAANTLRAHVSGPHAQLIRYADEDERPLGLLGYYDRLVDTDYLWPNRAAGGIVDTSYVKLFVKDALLQYFQGSAGGSNGVVKVADKPNRVRASGVNWIDNGSFARDADLFDRDVQVGDVVKLRFADSDVELFSYVSGFAGDAVAATVGSAAVDDANADTTGGALATFSQTHGPFNAVEITAASAAAYNPFPTGQVTETYTIIVTGSSTNGDFTTAKLRILSASGLDDVAEKVPSHQGAATTIGTLGATATFDASGGGDMSASAEDNDISPNDLLVGQRFTVQVRAAFTAIAAPTAGGTYTGEDDTTYVIEVTKGIKYAAGDPEITVTTTTGVDVSGPSPVTAAAVAIPVGKHGVTATFAGIGLVKGDRYTIVVTAQGVGAMKTLVLGNTIPSDVTDGEEADVTLYIRNPLLEIGQNRLDTPPLTNFDTSATQVTVKSGITATDPSWTDDGELLSLTVESASAKGYGRLYVQYRAWLPTLCSEVNGMTDVGELNDGISGALDPDNPLKWAMFKSLSNSNGVEVKFTSVCNPDDTDAWTDVLDLLLGRDDVYGLVPLTRNATVLDLYAAHVTAQSAAEQALWRKVWVSLSGFPEVPVVHAGSTVVGHTAATTSDDAVALATIIDDPDTTGTQYTLVTVPGSNADFTTNDVRAGDILRANYTSDGFGNSTYSEYVIDAVLTEESLRLVSGPGSPVNVASKIEVWRNLTATEEAAEIAHTAGAYASRRVCAVWPDTIETAGTVQEGYHLCAALAGLRSGILPHQGMTNLAISGFDAVTRTTDKFNKTQLDTMAGSGVWIVTQKPTGEVYTRHAVTTADYSDINAREEMITTNVDSISYRFKDTFEPFIGVSNVTPSLISLLRLEVLALIEVLKTESFTTQLGGQIISATIRDLRQHHTLKDRIVLILDLQVPYALNNLEVHLVVPAATAVTATAVGAGATTDVSTPTTTG